MAISPTPQVSPFPNRTTFVKIANGEKLTSTKLNEHKTKVQYKTIHAIIIVEPMKMFSLLKPQHYQTGRHLSPAEKHHQSIYHPIK